jgi:hypothetical protein
MGSARDRLSCGALPNHINFLGVARSHLDRHLAIFAQLEFLTGQPCLGELEGSNRSARRPVPQFRGEGSIRISIRLDRSGRPATTPRRFFAMPSLSLSIAHDAGAAGDRQVSFVAWIDKGKADIGLGLDLMLLGAVDIGHEKNQAGIAVWPCFERSRTQPADELRREACTR